MFSPEDFVCCFQAKCRMMLLRDGENCDYISSSKEKQKNIKNISDFSDLIEKPAEITVKYALLYSLLPTFTPSV